MGLRVWSIRGEVVNQNGNPIEGVLVKVEGTDKQAVTTSSGGFQLSWLEPFSTITLQFFLENVLVYSLDVYVGRENTKVGTIVLPVQPQPELFSINIEPSEVTLIRNRPQQLTATGVYADGTTRNITNDVYWESNDPAIAQVSNETGTKGVVTGTSPGGPVTISARLGTVTGTASVSVVKFGDRVLLVSNINDEDIYDYTIDYWNETAYQTDKKNSSAILSQYPTVEDLISDYWCIWIGVKGEITDTEVIRMMQPGGVIDEFVKAGGIFVSHAAHTNNDPAKQIIQGPGGFEFIKGRNFNDPNIVDANHEYINGTRYGGVTLTDFDFSNWINTGTGYIGLSPEFTSSGGQNLGTNPEPGRYNIIMVSPTQNNQPVMVEYCYGGGYGIIDMMNFDYWEKGTDVWTGRQNALRQSVQYTILIKDNFIF
ncbi:Ig-like domain-containing protein [Salipaludibacillus aurantiacus]|uniref:Carboxypeptidase regulatory-like domain-containing protein n=1 Tax=Salipaludibacillus aurantiacus TaxID=1601833 RepID=A0A1H9W517_9BACI|nr:Ig-like domain-containing protein [Salipaludibacillus aurantiacus]SES28851.1 Carboxypeptidase regulatory-like domain-containing protein [Salipaludibacillus aurantiacus]